MRSRRTTSEAGPAGDVSSRGRESSKGKHVGRKNGATVLLGKTLACVALIYVCVDHYVKSRGVKIPTAAMVWDDGNRGGGVRVVGAQPESATDRADEAPAERDWSHCQNPPPPKTKKEESEATERIEPMWLPAYPTSLPSGYAAFLQALTGVGNGAKSYYAVSKALRRCHPKRDPPNIFAITCEIVHPIVPCQRPSPSAQSANFGKKVLLSLRNPLTAFPAYHQSKAEAYHGQVGQVSVDQWEKFRDEWVESKLFDEWKGFITEWRGMEPYAVSEYLPYEHWRDEGKGPEMARRLARIVDGEGFPILHDDGEGIECLWHEHVYEPLAAEEKKRSEEGWYEPQYTRGQLEIIAGGLEKFATEIKEKQNAAGGGGGNARPGDERLAAILSEYANAVRREME